jgi:uncharacterized coiled-coil DUF342 family protein
MVDIVGGFRTVVQDLLVQELKAIRKELESHTGEFKQLWEEIKALRQDIRDLHQEMDARFERMHQEMDARFGEMNTRFEVIYKDIQDIKANQQEILSKLDIDRRIGRLEVIVEELRKAS